MLRDSKAGLSSILLVTFIGVAGYLLYVIRNEVMLMFTAIIFASALDPMVAWFEQRGWRRSLALTALYVVVIAVLFVVIAMVIPVVADQVVALSQKVPDVARVIGTRLSSLQLGDEALVESELIAARDSILGGSTLVHTFSFSIDALFSTVVFFVLTSYLVMSERDLRQTIQYFVPTHHHARADELLTRIQHKLGLWLRNQLIVMGVIGVSCMIALALLGVPEFVVLGLFSGLMEMVPYFGPIVGAVPAVLVALSISPAKAAMVIVAYVILQQLQNHLLTPRLMGRTVGLNPLIIIIAVLIGARLNGVIGTLLAVPVATVISVVLADVLIERDKRRVSE